MHLVYAFVLTVNVLIQLLVAPRVIKIFEIGPEQGQQTLSANIAGHEGPVWQVLLLTSIFFACSCFLLSHCVPHETQYTSRAFLSISAQKWTSWLKFFFRNSLHTGSVGSPQVWNYSRIMLLRPQGTLSHLHCTVIHKHIYTYEQNMALFVDALNKCKGEAVPWYITGGGGKQLYIWIHETYACRFVHASANFCSVWMTV
jgi:hypothetical protein